MVPGENMTYLQTRWGGSFWHHDPEDTKTAVDFKRRIERLLGLTTDVPGSRRRVFIRAVNSTTELHSVHRLHTLLCETLPDCEVKLLLLVDLQCKDELVQPADFGRDVLIYRVHGAIFAEDYSQWSMEACVENYARGIASAVKHWSGVATDIREVTNIQVLNAECNQMDGGSATSETFWPRQFRGQRLTIRRPKQLPHLLVSEHCNKMDIAHSNSNKGTPSSPPVRLPAQTADLVIPHCAKAGDLIRTRVFGQNLDVQVPSGAVGGQLLQLQHTEGVVTVLLAATTLSMTAAAAATAAQPSPGHVHRCVSDTR